MTTEHLNLGTVETFEVWSGDVLINTLSTYAPAYDFATRHRLRHENAAVHIVRTTSRRSLII